MLQPAASHSIFFRMDTRGGVQSCVLALIAGLNARGIVPELVWDLPPDLSLLEEAGVCATFRKVRFIVPTRLVDRLPDTLRYLPIALNGLATRWFFQKRQKVFAFVNWVHPKSSHDITYYCSGPPLLPQLEPPRRGISWFLDRVQKCIYRALIRPLSPAYEVHVGSKCYINSNFTAGLLWEAHRERMPVLYPPIMAATSPTPFVSGEPRDSVLFFSRIVDYKRPDLVIDLARNHPETRFVVAGAVAKNRQAYFDGLVDSAAGLSNVVFLPNVPLSELETEFARARIYIFPARDEHFGMTTAEAIARGICPFVHDSGGQRELVCEDRLRFDYVNLSERFSDLIRMSDAEIERLHLSVSTVLPALSAENFCRKMLSDSR